MKYESKVQFKCDHCKRSVTGKKHFRILIGWDSGFMAPPFIGGMPVARFTDRKPEFHFCQPECIAAFFVQKGNEIRTDTRRDERKNRIGSKKSVLLQEIGFEGSPMRGADNLGTRYQIQRKEGERDLGDSAFVRKSTFSGPVPRYRHYGQENQRVDRIEPHEESGREKVSEVQLGTKENFLKRIIREVSSMTFLW